MKRIFAIFLLAALLLLGCAPEETVYTVTVNRNGIDYNFTVDTEHCTISDGQYAYTYAVRGDSTTITYPNGARYYWTQNGNFGTGGWDNNYEPDTYVDGDILIDILSENAPREKHGNIPAGILLIVLGAFDVLCPHVAWYLSRGWWYKNAEPSDAALVVARISGVAVVIIGLFSLFA